VLYYLAIRAYDAGGLESAMSDVQRVRPQKILSASELAGEKGGFCGTSVPAGLIGLGVAIIMVGLRRKEFGLAALLLLVPQLGEATSQMSATQVAEDEKPAKIRQFTDLRYGTIDFQSQAINQVFTESNHQALYIDTGYSFKDIVGLSMGLGLIREKGFQVSAETGAQSTTPDMLNVLPLNAAVIVRADIFNEQLLVPYASAGVDYWLWRETWGNEDAEQSISGGKQGQHYAVGGQILLDGFDKVAASLLEVKRGITDTYLSVEYRSQEFTGDGLNFNSESITVGLRFNH